MYIHPKRHFETFFFPESIYDKCIQITRKAGTAMQTTINKSQDLWLGVNEEWVQCV